MDVPAVLLFFYNAPSKRNTLHHPNTVYLPCILTAPTTDKVV